ncbi:Villin-4, partial [Bienertia sinuspersici]
VLKLHFRSHCYDLVIPDIDKCLLLEIINDMVDGYESNGWELPKFPILQYSYKQKNHHLVDDGTLMKMFVDKKSKEVDIWVGCLPEPNFIWTLAQETRNSNQEKALLEAKSKKVEKIPVRRSSMVFDRDAEVVVLEGNGSQNNFPSPPHSEAPPVVFNSSPIHNPSVEIIFPNDTQIANSSQPPQSEEATNQSIVLETSKKTRKPKFNSFPHGKKMPKSTAIMKGLWVPQTTSMQVDRGEQSHDTAARPRRSLMLSSDAMVEVVEGESDSDSEGDYEPQDISGDESDDGNNIDYEEEDIEGLLTQNYVDGNWDPLQSNDWCPEDSGKMTKVFKNADVFEDAEIGDIKLKKWQLFVDKEHFKDSLRDYCIQEGFALVVVKSDNVRYTAECADMRCSWRIHAAILEDGHTWAIKTLEKNHQCDLNLVNNPMCNCDWAAKKLIEDIRANPDIKGKTMNSLLWERWGLSMATSTLYRMRTIALQLIQGGHDESYTNLPQYCQLLMNMNPNTIAFCTWAQVEHPRKALQFRSIFISFEAQFRGLIEGCRGLVGVDGCHLKGNYGGILLSAVSLDGNNEIFPVAVAVVDSENKTSWSWFFHHLKTLLTQNGRNDWTIILTKIDSIQGIDPSLDDVWPKVPRRYCARHLCKNFKKDYPGMLMHKMFWSVTNSFSAYSFKKALTQLQSYAGLGAVKWFKDIGPLETWTKWKFDPTLHSDENTNNFVESFNSTIGVDRCYPVLTLLEG